MFRCQGLLKLCLKNTLDCDLYILKMFNIQIDTVCMQSIYFLCIIFHYIMVFSEFIFIPYFKSFSLSLFFFLFINKFYGDLKFYTNFKLAFFVFFSQFIIFFLMYFFRCLKQVLEFAHPPFCSFVIVFTNVLRELPSDFIISISRFL